MIFMLLYFICKNCVKYFLACIPYWSSRPWNGLSAKSKNILLSINQISSLNKLCENNVAKFLVFLFLVYKVDFQQNNAHNYIVVL